MSDADPFVRLSVWTAPQTYRTIAIARADVVEVRDVPDDFNPAERLYHATVVTTRERYIVNESMHEACRRVWPAAPKCPTCKRPT